MSKTIFLIVITSLILTTNVYAEDYFCVDQNNKVNSYKRSIDPSIAPAGCILVTDVPTSRSLVDGVSFKYLKVVDGQLVEMTSEEKATVDNVETTTLATKAEQDIDNLNVNRNELIMAILELIQEKAAISITAQEIADTIRENRNE